MNPLDSRYLVPVSVLPFRPRGIPTCLIRPPFGPSVVEYLDLSAPTKIDGIPDRLDAVGWALEVVSAWHSVYIDDLNELRPMTGDVWRIRDRGNYLTVLRSTDPDYEEYDYEDPDQPRRILAAVLRKGRPGLTP